MRAMTLTRFGLGRLESVETPIACLDVTSLSSCHVMAAALPACAFLAERRGLHIVVMRECHATHATQ
jgi:hypothetical protein